MGATRSMRPRSRPPGPAFFCVLLVVTPALAQAAAGTGVLDQAMSLVRRPEQEILAIPADPGEWGRRRDAVRGA